MRMWVCRMRPSSHTISRCLPWLSTRSMTRPGAGCGPIETWSDEACGRLANQRGPERRCRSVDRVPLWHVHQPKPDLHGPARDTQAWLRTVACRHGRGETRHRRGRGGPDESQHLEYDAPPIDPSVDDATMMAAARRRHGALGGVVAAGMLGIDKVLGRKPREEIPVVVDAPTEPVDIDADGITVPLDAHTDVISPPLPRSLPKVAPARRRSRHRLTRCVRDRPSIARCSVARSPCASSPPSSSSPTVIGLNRRHRQGSRRRRRPPRDHRPTRLLQAIESATDPSDRVTVEVVTDNLQAARGQVIALAGIVTGSVPGEVLQVSIPVGRLEALAAAPAVQMVRRPAGRQPPRHRIDRVRPGHRPERQRRSMRPPGTPPASPEPE